MNNAKILVAIPYHNNKKYCIKQLLSRVEELTYKRKEVVMRWDLAKYGGKNNVKMQREHFRDLALAGNYTHLFFLGVDTIPPADVLERLLAHKKAIVGGVYWGRHGAENGSSQGAVAWKHGISPEAQRESYLERNKLLLIDGMGMDCVLFRRDVLEKSSWLTWEQNDDDYPYYDQAKRIGLEEGIDYGCYIDTNVQCRHYFDNKRYTYLAKVCQDKVGEIDKVA